MKQVVQNLRSGVLELLDVPAPRVSGGHVLIQSVASLISAGTERSLVEFGRASLVAKARQNPERVKMVLEKIKTDGFLPTLEAVFSKLDEPMPLGYCNAGRVVEVGSGVDQLAVGDRVASNAPHAEVFNQPINLCAKIPDGVSDEQAAFTPLAAIAMQGVRLLAPTLGENVVVFGLGLVGLMAVQMLVESGVRVLAIDLDEAKLKLAEEFGSEAIDARDGGDVIRRAIAFSGGSGVDGVLIAASAKNDSIVSQAAQMSRKRGRIVLVGVVDLQLNRGEFYEKELSFQVSCSYGPGRYDPVYEEQGTDYPLPFVRWTEKRNFQAALEMMARRRLNVERLITERIPHADAARAYDLLASDRGQLGVVFQYPSIAPPLERIVTRNGSATSIPSATAKRPESAGKTVAGIVGAGNFTRQMLLPSLQKTEAVLASIASAGGVTAAHCARKFNVAASTTDWHTMLADDRINTIFIATRPGSHAPMVVEALDAGKHVFVEKPLAIDDAGLDAVRQAVIKAPGRHLTVGFNRRFSPHARKMRELLASRSTPLSANILVNAGRIPPDHWIHDKTVGGGRMINEGCHWIDLLRFLVGSPIVEVKATMVGDAPGVGVRDDQIAAVFSFADGSIGTVHYFSSGHRGFPKERVEVFCEERVLELDNFRVLRGYGYPSFRKLKLFRQDKGHATEFESVVDRINRGAEPLMKFDEMENVTLASFAAVTSARDSRTISLP